MKKAISLVLVLALMLSLCAAVFAESYTDWTDAAKLPTATGSYKLMTDVTIDTFAGVDIGSKSVVLDLNGYTVTFTKGYYYVRSGGSLVIEDSSSSGTGRMITGASSSKVIYANGSGASVEIRGGTVVNEGSSGNALYLNAGAIGILSGGTIENTGANGYAVFINSASSFTMNGGTVKNSNANSGRAVNVNGGTFTMNAGAVESAPNGSTPAIYGNGAGAAIVINDGDITAGSASGGGIAISSANGPVTITGGDIEAGRYALETRYATVEPASGKTVNITAGNAVLNPYSAPTDGSDGNVLNGGNYEAPALTTGSNGDNAKVSGGSFTDGAGNAMDVEDNLYGATVDSNGVVTPCPHSNTELKNAVPETCADPGYTGDVVCKDCGLVVTPGNDINPNDDHDPNSIVREGEVPATCVDPGYTGDLVCTDCGRTVTPGDATDPTGRHTPGKIGFDGGAHWDVCSVCGAYHNFRSHTDGNADGLCDICGWNLSSGRVNPNTGVRF